MKTSNAIKKLTKMGVELTISEDQKRIEARFGDDLLTIHSQIDWQTKTHLVLSSISSTNTRLLSADTNMMNGNCYTTYYDNLTQALKIVA